MPLPVTVETRAQLVVRPSDFSAHYDGAWHEALGWDREADMAVVDSAETRNILFFVPPSNPKRIDGMRCICGGDTMTMTPCGKPK